LRPAILRYISALAILLLALPSGDEAQSIRRRLITQPIDESRLVRLTGNTRLEAIAKNDLGRAASDLRMDMYLQLRRSPELDAAAQKFVESLTDRSSVNFHKWITAAEYGQRFGASSEDIETVSRWLRSHGFAVNGIAANNMVIDFSGNAAQVQEALHTEIHNLSVEGRHYFANMSDPQIPAALLPGVTGVVSLSNIMPQKMLVPRGEYTVNAKQTALVPGDLATIYNLTPAFAGGFTGRGQTVVLIEDTDLYNGNADWNTFRQTFGLAAQFPHASLTQVHPAPGKGGGSACQDPGVNGADDEAALDVQWASAAAPDATLLMASCADTTNFGGFIALQNLLTNGGALPSVVSISYGQSETDSGASENSYINTLYQTAAAAGVSVFVSSGDEAAAETDHRSQVAIHGVSVNSFASSPYDVAVGGTDFGDTAAGSTPAYWNTTNGLYYDSAKSYVPEIPWNNSCAGAVLAAYKGYSTSYGASGYCNSTYDSLIGVGGSGGPSGCASGSPAVNGVVGGTCAGYAKPSWQSIPGNPNDGVRDLPDVALFSSSGFWGHYYVFCISDGGGCSGAPSNWAGAGGTSFAAPIMAGIQALINQAAGETNVGNPNPVYYAIGQSEYASGASACNSTTGPASTCPFNDVTTGDMSVPCAGAFNCFFGDGGLGVLSTSNSSYQPAYGTGPGWDFATGIGTVNAYNLLGAFVNALTPTGAPAAPLLVSPANSAANILPQPLLTWTASAQATSYDVYFGTTAPPPMVANTANINYSPGTLSPGTTYYWTIGARNSLGANVALPWSFTTNCVALINPSSAVAPAGGGAGTIPITASDGCSWTAASNVSWIAITSGSSGSGSGSVGYSVAADTGTARIGTLTIGGQTFTVTQAVNPLISTLAGGGLPPTSAPGASLSIPVSYGIAVDAAGNTYFSSPALNAVFRADPAGVTTLIAGNGIPGYAGDGGPALSAQLYFPEGVAVDASGNLYIADSANRRIRKVSPAGTITTVAGNGNCCGFTGDGGSALSAQIGTPYGIAVDASGNLFFTDISNSVIRKVTPSGTIATVAGNGTYGYLGDGGLAASAEFREPFGLTVDSSGNLYVADTYNERIRRVTPDGTVTTIAGSGNCCYGGDGGPAVGALMSVPTGVARDSAGNLYIADSGNNRIRKVTTAGVISTVAGTAFSGYAGDGGAANNARLATPQGIAIDVGGNLYISDSANARIRSVSSGNGTIATLVGGATGDGGPGIFAWLNQPSGVARDNAGNTYVADTGNHRVRKVAANGTISTYAGTGLAGFSTDAGTPAAGAPLNGPHGLAVDAAGNLYIADGNNYRVRKVDTSGNISTVAGNGVCCGRTGDGGAATSAQIGVPYALAVDASGSLYIGDINNNVVRKVTASGTISTVAGNGIYGYSGDGGLATSAAFREPYALAPDGSGNLYIADRYNSRIRMVDPGGTVTTVAGNGNCCFTGDGGPAANAALDSPAGLALDAAGNLYIADLGISRIRVVNAAGTISTVAGTGYAGFSGDGGPAVGAAIQYPWGLAADAAGNVVFADYGNNALRLLTPAGTLPVLSVQSSHSGAFAQGQTGAVYTLTVANGAGAAPTNGTVSVNELPPAGMSVVSMSGTGWNCSVAMPVCSRSDTLNGGASYPAITVTVNVSANASGQLTNQTTVSGGGAPAAAKTGDLTVVTAAGQ
jgi:sugar lactone lactonase YvrE